MRGGKVAEGAPISQYDEQTAQEDNAIIAADDFNGKLTFLGYSCKFDGQTTVSVSFAKNGFAGFEPFATKDFGAYDPTAMLAWAREQVAEHATKGDYSYTVA